MHVGTADVADHTSPWPNTPTVSELMRWLRCPPFYYTDHTPWEITAHFETIAAAVESPLFLYDDEKYAGYRFSRPAVEKELKEEVPSLSCG